MGRGLDGIMQIKVKNSSSYSVLGRIITMIMALIIICICFDAKSGSRFISSYSCSDADKYCISSGTRTIDGFEVTRDCWEWGYTKTCNVPSLNDCSQHARCYSLGRRNCLLKDYYGACINWEKEFSCKRWVPTYLESSHVRYDTEEKEGQEGLVCKGIPCIDGNCIDKSYEMDEEMMNSVSKLYALSQGQSDGYNFKIFEGAGRHCSKKPVGYSNCCRLEKPGAGWGKEIGAKCTKDENYLMEQRQKNFCVYVGKKSSKTLGVTTVIKHHFCCFSNILEKIIQVQGRAQLGINFGSGGSPDCRGLTLEELERIDFSLIDFSEFAEEVQKRMVLPKGGDVEERILGSLPNINRFDEDRPAREENKLAGVNQTLIGPTEEEIRLEEERLARLEEERLEAQRLEQERIAREEEEKRIRLAQEQRREQLNTLKRQKELELAEVNSELPVEERQSLYYWKVSPTNQYQLSKLRISFLRKSKTRLEKELQEIEAEFSNGILLPEQLISKREAKRSELKIAEDGLAKAKNRASPNLPYYSYYILEAQLYQQEVDRLEQDLREEAY